MGITATATDPAAARTERDAILEQVRTAGDLPDWCWTQITEALAGFDRLGPVAASLGLAYARAVRQRGASMFARPGQLVLLGEETPPGLSCSAHCGGRSGPPRSDDDHGRTYLTGDCLRCGQVLVHWTD